jgi:hypothetical protein
MASFWVQGIVNRQDQQPLVVLSNENGMIAQLTVAQARIIALDILSMAARAEADAMIYKFFEKSKFPREAAIALMANFRDFRAQLDEEIVERHVDPDAA